MKYDRILIALSASIATIFSGCSEERFVVDGSTENVATINLTADYMTTSRVTDAGFADGDRMGIFIMDYENGEAKKMEATGNRADNVLFTYSEAENKWNGFTTIYWKNNTTPVDVVGYYPFDNNLQSVNDYTFSIAERQDKEATNGADGGYESSDFLWAERRNVAPTSDEIHLLYNHIMAGITVRLVEGSGFQEGEWADATKQVWVDNTTLDASIDLTIGKVSPIAGNVKKIIPLPSGDEYRAVVVPQSVAANKPLIGINIDNVTYTRVIESEMNYIGGKMHTFTIEVNKRADSGTYEFVVKDESVTAWIDDMEFHDGLLREYVVVEVSERGTLKQTIKDMGLDAAKISNLKVKGIVNWDDLRYMGQEMYITHLNLYDARIDDENDENDDVITGFEICKTLSKIVFPKILRGISDVAFRRAGITGDLVIPEGVTFVGYAAFNDCPINGGITLPSTLKRIESGAFSGGITGELRLPEGIEYIGGGAFGINLSGPLVLPKSLKFIGGGAFNSCKFTGSLIIHQGIEFENGGTFGGCKFSHIELPEGITTLYSQMFCNMPLQGELIIPNSVTQIYDACFLRTNISRVKLPDNLKILEARTFAECTRLEGIIEIPKGITVIEKNVFSDCHMLDGVHLHSDMVFIAKEAFKNCYNMNTIICDALTPPVIEDGAFDGVPKDNFTVEVPASAISAYRMADGWKEFKRIAPYSNFVCRPGNVCAINNRHSEELILNADDSWRVTHIPDWCELSATSGIGKTALRLTVKDMAHGSECRRDSIVFELNGGQFSTYCTVEQQDYEYEEDQLVTLQSHTKGNGVDIIFIGDGYDAASLAEGKFIDLAREEMEYFFGLPPYDRLRDYFNVYAAISLSQEQGINTVNTYRNTRFKTIFGGSEMCGGNGPNLIPSDELIFPYVAQMLGKREDQLGRTLIILLPNTTEYSGVSYLYNDGRAISICPQSTLAYPDDTRGVVQREAGGFGFGKLATEKVLRHAFAKQSIKDTVNEYQSWYGWYKNISTTGKLSEVPWAHYIFDPRYSDYVDVFEGGYNYSRGFFRSESQSCMSTSIPYYNTISRELITRRVLDYAGEWFDMEDFYNNDTNSWGSSGLGSRSSSAVYPSEVESTFNMPIVIKGKYIPNKPKYKGKKQNR